MCSYYSDAAYVMAWSVVSYTVSDGLLDCPMLFYFFIVCFACWFGTENPGCSVVSDMINWFDSVLGSIAIFLWLGCGSLS